MIPATYARNQPKASRSQDLGIDSTFAFTIPADCRYSFDAVEIHAQANRWVGWAQDNCFAVDGVCYTFFMKSLVDNSGHSDANQHQNFRIFYSKSFDGGATWSDAQMIIEDSTRPTYQGSMSGAADKNGLLYVARRVVAYDGSIQDHNNSHIGLRTDSNPDGEKFEVFTSSDKGESWSQLQWNGSDQWPSSQFLDYRHGGIFWEPIGGDKIFAVGFYAYTYGESGRSGFRLFNLTQNTWKDKFIFQTGLYINEPSIVWDAKRNVFFGFTRTQDLYQGRFWICRDNFQTFEVYVDNASGIPMSHGPIIPAISPDGETYFALLSERYDGILGQNRRVFLLEAKAEDVLNGGVSAFKFHLLGQCTVGADGSTGTPSVIMPGDRIVWATSSKGPSAYGGMFAIRQFVDQPSLESATLSVNLIDNGNGTWNFDCTWNLEARATSYRVQYRAATDTSWTSVDKLSTDSSHLFSNLPPHVYYVRLVTLLPEGEGLYSAHTVRAMSGDLSTLLTAIELASASDPNGSGLANWLILVAEMYRTDQTWIPLGSLLSVPSSVGSGSSLDGNWQNNRAAVNLNSSAFDFSGKDEFITRTTTKFCVSENPGTDLFWLDAESFESGAGLNSDHLAGFATRGTIHSFGRNIDGSYVSVELDSSSIPAGTPALLWTQRNIEEISAKGESPVIDKKITTGITSRPEDNIRLRIGNSKNIIANPGKIAFYAYCNIALEDTAIATVVDALKTYYALP